MWVSIGNTGSATTAPVMNVTTVNTNQAAALMTASASATTMKNQCAPANPHTSNNAPTAKKKKND
jgi:hypothetical protein